MSALWARIAPMGKLVSIAKRIMPTAVFRYFKGRACENVFRKLRKEYPAYRERMLKRVEAVRQKEVINVLFYIWQPSFWKVDSLFRLMLEHPRFNPVVCPVPVYDFQDPVKRQQVLAETRSYFKQKGYPVLEVDGVGPIAKSFVLTKNGIDVIRKSFAPDIIFVQNPYETVQEAIDADMEHELYCYVPYGFRNSLAHFSYNNATQNKYLFNFVENQYISDFCHEIMANGGTNLRVTGYPPVDYYLFPEKCASRESVWKPQVTPCKKIIWAPHWALHDGSIMKKGSFLQVADFMLEYAKKAQGRAQFAFKPHPKLKEQLYNLPDWGVERTDAYYAQWAALPNSQLEQGEYADLFLQSDAMIHDSGSFIVEYMATGKPCCFLHSKVDYPDANKMTVDALAAHYTAETAQEAAEFLERVVFMGDDPMQQARMEYVRRYLIPPNGCSAAHNIIQALLGNEQGS